MAKRQIVLSFQSDNGGFESSRSRLGTLNGRLGRRPGLTTCTLRFSCLDRTKKGGSGEHDLERCSAPSPPALFKRFDVRCPGTLVHRWVSLIDLRFQISGLFDQKRGK